jgi:hypothetical protein
VARCREEAPDLVWGSPTIIQDSVRLLVPHQSPVARRANLTSPSGSLHSHRSTQEVVCCCVSFLALASGEGKESIEEPVEVFSAEGRRS